MSTTLERTTFTTSRLLEFFTEKELAMQIGHDRAWWPAALLKELLDNALDACETAGVSPEIDVVLENDVLSVRDNGPGIPAATIERALDYLVRVSDKAYYVSPTRGQLGNALKCVYAAAYVATGEEGQTDIYSGGQHHRVLVTLDRLAQRPDLDYTVEPDPFVKTGTLVEIHWPGIASLLYDEEECVSYIGRLLTDYAAFNPHASFTWSVEGDDIGGGSISPTDSNWRKWRPGDPTSPHWYSVATLRSLIAAYVTDEQNGGRVRTVREFVSEFHGLSGTAKQKATALAAGLSGAYLHDLVVDGDVAAGQVEALLAALKQQSRAPKPGALGPLGKDHMIRHLVTYRHVDETTINYKKMEGTTYDGMPFIVEVALGIQDEDREDYRDVVVGLNWTPALKMPIRELQALLSTQRIDYQDPVTVLAHVVCPVLQWADRGKGVLDLQPEIHSTLKVALAAVGKEWLAAKRNADRENRVRRSDLERMRTRYQEVTIKDAAYAVMERAYLAASAGGTLPANARMVMYAARPLVLEMTGGKCWKDSAYFTQTLLPGFMDEYSELAGGWNVVFDARGHFEEPYTKERIDLGTLEVRRYVNTWSRDGGGVLDVSSILPDTLYPTSGPADRYAFALFVEKEGYRPLLTAAHIAERFGIAIMSTKGMTTTAARELIDRLSDRGVTILVLHDFDKAGFSIVATLASSSWRYTFDHAPNVVDLGLRLADVEEMGLASEPVDYAGEQDPRWNLRDNGATPAECDYLVRTHSYKCYHGERVELNAMTADQFVRFLEARLKAAGVTKVVPEAEVLERAYVRAVQMVVVRRAAKDALAQVQATTIDVPADLAERVASMIADNGTSWDEAVLDIVDQREPEGW